MDRNPAARMQFNLAIEELSTAHGPARQALLEKQILAR